MFKKIMLVLLIVSFLYAVSSAQETYTVTIRMNASTAPVLVDDDFIAENLIQVRGSVAPLTWGDDSFNMTHVDGDYWEAVIPFTKADVEAAGGNIEFKFFLGDWEAGDNKMISPTGDMVTDLYYYNNGVTPPYEPSDSMDVWFRVFAMNLSGFTPANGDYISVRGARYDTEPDTNYTWGDLDWGANLSELYAEGAEGLSANFFSGVLRFPAEEADIQYKFITYATDGTVGWESIENRHASLKGNDTTLQWVYWNNEEPSMEVDTFNLTIVADMSHLMSGGWFEAGVDTITIPGTHNGWSRPDNAILEQDFFDETKFSKTYEGLVAGMDDMNEMKFKAYPDYKFVDDGWEGRPNRQWYYKKTGDTTLTFVPDIVSLYPLTESEVTVHFSVDMNGAGYNVEDQLNVFESVDRVFAVGSWASDSGQVMPSGVTWGGGIGADSVDKLIEEEIVIEFFDDGSTAGDQAAGDKIFSGQIVRPAESYCGFLLQFGCLANGITDSTFAEGADQGDKHGFNFPYNQAEYTHPAFKWITSEEVDIIEYNRDGFNHKAFQLTQNYPNPFNPTTRFSFNVPEKAKVSVKVYNIMGQEIETLVNSWLNVGAYTVVWDGAKQASGVYFYKVSMNGKSQTKKMLLMK